MMDSRIKKNGKNNKKSSWGATFLLAALTASLFVGCASNNSTVSENPTSTESLVSTEEQESTVEAEVQDNLRETEETVTSTEETQGSVEEPAVQNTTESANQAEESTPDSESLPVEQETVVSDPVEFEDVEEEEETDELDEMTTTQRDSINMLNYITVLTQEINDSKGSRIYLESAYSSLINNTYPNAVDTRTQAQITSILDTLNEYRMISVKRERLEYIYEQNRAQALRQAIPNPLGLLSTVQSGNLLKTAASVLYMAVDSTASYQTAATQTEMKYLEDNWEFDDAEDEELHNSRSSAFTYMLNMVRDNDLPGDFALNEDSVKDFVKWANEDNLVRKIAWLESNESTYKEFRTYWLELARSYYESKDYRKCLESIEQYEEVATRIFRKDYDYAETIPMAIISAKETMIKSKYNDYADKYAGLILENCDEDDWTLRYFVAQIYIDLYTNTEDEKYLEAAYEIAFNNVNILVDEQKELNTAYLAEIKEAKADKDATKREKQEVKYYNKLLKEERKVALPPVSEAFYLNCDLLFALADELNISRSEKKDIDYILHEDGESIFLTKALDDRFWFNNSGEEINSDNIEVEFNGKELVIPATCITDRSVVKVSISSGGKLDDWAVSSVERPKNADCSTFMVTLTSKQGKEHKYTVGEKITITVIPVAETPEEVIEFTYEVVGKKTLGVIKGIKIERTTK